MLGDVSREGIPTEYCVGKQGFDKNLSLDEVIEFIAKPKKANLIVKTGPNAKWYVKNISVEDATQTIKSATKNYIATDKSKCYVVSFDAEATETATTGAVVRTSTRVGKPTTRAMTRAMTHANASRTRKTTAAPALVDVTETKNSVIPSFDMKEVADEVEGRRWSGPTRSQKSFTDLMCAIRWAEQSANKMHGWMYPGVKVSQQHQHEQ